MPEFLKLDDYPPCIFPEEAKALVKQMIKIEQADRLTIEQVIDSSLFDGVRDLQQPPEFDELHGELRTICKDFITRGNVYKYSGQEKFDSHFEKEVRPKFPDTWKDKLDFVRENALNYIFEIDP